MRYKSMLFNFVAFLVLLPSLASASNWILFTSSQSGVGWYYDKESIVYLKAKSIIGIELPLKDRNYPKMWIKSAGDKGEISYQVEFNCKGRTAQLQDDSGKTLYSESSIYYLYDKQIVPDSVLDKLYQAICR